MKDFLEGGKGLIPLHSATGCFKNSEWYIQTIGGQFDSHGVGTFKSRILMARHPVTQGLEDFETWDETYIHRKINPDIEILMERIEGDIKESDSEKSLQTKCALSIPLIPWILLASTCSFSNCCQFSSQFDSLKLIKKTSMINLSLTLFNSLSITVKYIIIEY
jgi:hypothetical protein